MMKKRVFGMLLSLCLVLMLVPTMALGEELTVTIDGADEVCAQQDYEFTVTIHTSEELKQVLCTFAAGSNNPLIPLKKQQDGVWSGTVPKEYYKDMQSFMISVGAHTTSGNEVLEGKIVDVSDNHVFVNGVCGCGEKLPTLTLAASYTTTVEQGGSAKPGKTDFALEVVDFDGSKLELDGVTVSGLTVNTNGVADYDGELTFTFTADNFNMISDGVFVRQVNEGADGWDYDPAVWYLWPKIAAELSDDAVQGGHDMYIFPVEEGKEGYEILWGDDDYYGEPKMTFTNIYTKEDGDVTNLPKTGDSSNLAAWLVLLAVSAAGVTGAAVHGRRRKSARE